MIPLGIKLLSLVETLLTLMSRVSTISILSICILEQSERIQIDRLL
jgi:hypothetical protein